MCTKSNNLVLTDATDVAFLRLQLLLVLCFFCLCDKIHYVKFWHIIANTSADCIAKLRHSVCNDVGTVWFQSPHTLIWAEMCKDNII